MTLLTSIKPLTLSPQEVQVAGPSQEEERTAGARAIVPEQGSKEARRRERALKRDERVGRSTSPCPSTDSASSSLPRNQDHSSSASSVRTPSPAASIPLDVASPSISPPHPTFLENKNSALPKDLWKLDGNADKCDGPDCDVRFGLFSARRHHCRRCGLIFCSDCSSSSHPLIYPRPPTPSASTAASTVFPFRGLPSPSSAVDLAALAPGFAEACDLIPSRVCSDCKRSLVLPTPLVISRPPMSRRSSSRGGTPVNHPRSTSPSLPLASSSSSLSYAAAVASTSVLPPSPRSPRVTTPSTSHQHARFSSNDPTFLSSVHSSTASLTSLHRTASSPSIQREAWMDGPLGEFPLAYQRRLVYDPKVQTLAPSAATNRRRRQESAPCPSTTSGDRSQDEEEDEHLETANTPQRFNPKLEHETSTGGLAQSYGGPSWSTF